MLTASILGYSESVSAVRAITLRLDLEDHRRLEAEAERLGVAPATLARVYVRAGLRGEDETVAERIRQAGLEALRGLAELRRSLPADGSRVDVVEIIAREREARDARLDR
jgi:hypothetical protein